MKWSLKLGRFAGIDVYVHATFFLLLAWFGYAYWSSTGSIDGVITGLSLILLLFGCVLLHEYGHALTARRYGIGTRHITLLPIGGVATLEAMPKDPRQEIIVALAGPAVNLAIAALLFLLIRVTDHPGAVLNLQAGRGSLLPTLLAANLMLAVFNLLPAFPMDGGRVLRAVLALNTDRVRATQIAAKIGRGVAIGFALLGLMGNPFLILIAAFVWIGAGAEAQAVAVDERLGGKPAGRAMITDFHTLESSDPLSHAIDLTLAGTQKDFPVLDNGALAGVLPQEAVMRGLRDAGPEGVVGDFAQPAETATAGTPLDKLLARMEPGGGARMVCILDGGRLTGFVDVENISEYLRIQAALSDH